MTLLTDTSPDIATGQADTFDPADWFTLEQSLKQGNVIPIVGPDALLVDYQGSTQYFYRLIAAELLRSFQLEDSKDLLEHTWALPKTVHAILAQNASSNTEKRVRREVSRLIADFSERIQPSETLKKLVNIGAFRLFVSLTPDGLLERAIRAANQDAALCCTSFSPSNSSASYADLSTLNADQRGIFQLLGDSSNVANGFAVHEEDTLEYLYTLQSAAARPVSSLLTEIHRCNKLLIGCNFPDWLGRAMLRLLNKERFYLKDTSDFLFPGVSDAGLKAFLKQYSPNTLGFDGPPQHFINLLWEKFAAAEAPPAAEPQATSPGLQPGPTIFVSYASENKDAARRIADSLVDVGFSDVWLDQKKLVTGDDWSDRIENAIEKCDFFMPLLSAQADSRREGVFWEEWNMAIKRARRIQDAFLLPVGIDALPAARAGYSRIVAGETRVFFDKHLLHAPGGAFSNNDREALTERCRRFMENNSV